MSNKKWKYFERVVTAVTTLHSKEATVNWNEVINGRQFDVTVRFRHGLHDYLTVIECKDQKKAVEVGQVEAFVTKSSDVNANKAIMVTSSSFQSGCFSVAKLHSVDLVTLREIGAIPPNTAVTAIIPASNFFNIRLVDEKGETITIPEGRGMGEYAAKQVKVQFQKVTISLETAILKGLKYLKVELTEKERETRIDFEEPPIVHIPDHLPDVRRSARIKTILIKHKLVYARMLTGESADPRLYKAFQYDNLISDEKTIMNGSELRVGFATRLEPGRYYDDPLMESYYYCVSVSGERVRMLLVESYQHGKLFQCEFYMRGEHSNRYIPVDDPQTIRRLNVLRERIKTKN